MSEYQSYEFVALDRLLDAEAQAALRRISTRGRITATSFSNEYHWGDFKGDPAQMMRDWFDVFVYYACWNTRWCMIRLPLGVLEQSAVAAYAGEVLTVETTETHLLLQWLYEEEDSGWCEEGEEWIGRLLPLREELLAGDLRSLCIGWLAQATWCPDEEAGLPPVPPGLGCLTDAQKALAEFLYVSGDLLAAAAVDSGHVPDQPAVGDEALVAWMRSWPSERLDAWLRRLVAGEMARPAEMLRREHALEHAVAQPLGPPSRPPSELMADAAKHRAEREARLAREAEARLRRAEAAAAAARDKHLDQIAGQDDDLWRQARQAASITQPKSYKACLDLLRDLRDLARRDLRTEPFELAMLDFRETHRRKPALLKMLDQAGL